MIDRNQGTICLGPTGNLQGSYAFLLLRTGRKITRNQYTELPTPPHVTQQAIAMDMHEKQQKGLVLDDCNGVELPMTDKDCNQQGKRGHYARAHTGMCAPFQILRR